MPLPFFHFQYDVNRDGIVDFVLSTSDAEILFLQPDNTLLHGETIKVLHGTVTTLSKQWALNRIIFFSLYMLQNH